MWIFCALLVLLGEEAASINLLRPSTLSLDVPNSLEPGINLFSLNGTSNHRYLVSNDDLYANAFFLANGQTLTTHHLVSLPNDANVSLSIIEEYFEGGTTAKVWPLVLRVVSSVKPASIRGRVLENEPKGTEVIIVEGDLAALASHGAEVQSGIFELTKTGNILTRHPLDREKTSKYHLKLVNPNTREILAYIEVIVEDVNDNLPMFNVTSTRLLWQLDPSVVRKYSIVGRVNAFDRDGDQVVYGLEHADPCCIVVPQSGEIILVNPDAVPTQLSILAKEKNNPARQSRLSAIIDIVDKDDDEEDDLLVDDIIDEESGKSHIRQKRRVTRAVRPTKRTEFTEADGQLEGKIVFQLEKESEHETFKIRDENPWVTVEPNGAVRVKKRWDYEELGREKTIDFWVIITNSGAAGKTAFSIYSSDILLPPRRPPHLRFLKGFYITLGGMKALSFFIHSSDLFLICYF
jgi:hypothetical protein